MYICIYVYICICSYVHFGMHIYSLRICIHLHIWLNGSGRPSPLHYCNRTTDTSYTLRDPPTFLLPWQGLLFHTSCVSSQLCQRVAVRMRRSASMAYVRLKMLPMKACSKELLLRSHSNEASPRREASPTRQTTLQLSSHAGLADLRPSRLPQRLWLLLRHHQRPGPQQHLLPQRRQLARPQKLPP